MHISEGGYQAKVVEERAIKDNSIKKNLPVVDWARIRRSASEIAPGTAPFAHPETLATTMVRVGGASVCVVWKPKHTEVGGVEGE